MRHASSADCVEKVLTHASRALSAPLLGRRRRRSNAVSSIDASIPRSMLSAPAHSPARASTPSGARRASSRCRRHQRIVRASARDDSSARPTPRTRRDFVRDALLLSTLGVAYGARAEDDVDGVVPPPAPKTPCVLITGANSGIGYTAAKQIAAQGKTVVMACRSVEKAERAARELREEVGANAKVVTLAVPLELTDLKSVREYALAFMDRSDLSLDALVCNAGIMAAPLERTAQGHELHFGVNHLGHFLLADALTPMLRESNGRLVSVSSSFSMIGDFALDLDDLDWNARKYDPWYAYGASKAENVLFADEFARREGRNGIVANSLHPGIVSTNLVRYSVPSMVQTNRDLKRERESFAGKLAAQAGIRNPDEGGRTSTWLATSDAAARETGKFFLDPGLEYPGATREQLIEAGDWFMPSGSEFLAPQLGFPEKLFEWRTEANAAKLWSTSQEMVSKYTV